MKIRKPTPELEPYEGPPPLLPFSLTLAIAVMAGYIILSLVLSL